MVPWAVALDVIVVLDDVRAIGRRLCLVSPEPLLGENGFDVVDESVLVCSRPLLDFLVKAGSATFTSSLFLAGALFLGPSPASLSRGLTTCSD